MIHETRSVSRSGAFLQFDFERAAFAQLEIECRGQDGAVLHVAIGECMNGKHIHTAPGGFRYYASADIPLKKGQDRYSFPIPSRRIQIGNSYAETRACVPPEAGGREIAPFRYVEVLGAPGPVTLIRREFFADIHEEDSVFRCADPDLEKVWEFCRYSIKATGCFGKYVDGERERVPYEGDTFINQLGHFCCAADFRMSKATIEYFFDYPTWPTEWVLLTPCLARDYLFYSGDRKTVQGWLPELEKKLLPELTGPDGLVRPDGKVVRDIVDWPQCERDDYEFGEVNFVPNAILMDALQAMYDLTGDRQYLERRTRARESLRKLMRTPSGAFVDSPGSRHISVHTVYSAIRSGVADPGGEAAFFAGFLFRRGMACSVFGAQFLLEACYLAHSPKLALELMTSHDRCSWFHMMESGSTISMEAWDDAIKPNQDWNHAWGAAPANIIPRYFCGIRPVKPGFARFVVDPQNCGVDFRFRQPTLHGPIELDSEGHLTVPEHTEAEYQGKVFPAGTHRLW